VAELVGLLEEVSELQQKGAVDLPDLADAVRLDIDALFPVLEALSVLELAQVHDGDITMTATGKQFIDTDINDKKILFKEILIKYIPLAKHIQQSLLDSSHQRISEEQVLRNLEEHFTSDEAERVLSTVIDWGRYAELFAYDYNTGMLSFEDVQ